MPVDYVQLSFNGGGEIVEVLVEEGDVVEAGQLLARLEQFDNREVSDLLAFIRSWQPLRSERREALELANSLRRLQPVHVWHLNIHEHNVKLVGLEGQKGSFPRIAPGCFKPSTVLLMRFIGTLGIDRSWRTSDTCEASKKDRARPRRCPML